MPTELELVSDALLMGYIADGREECVRLLIQRYERALMAFLRRALAGAPEAEDLFQETWIRVVRSAFQYDPTYRFSPWLFQIAWNLIRDYWSQRKTSEKTLINGDPAAVEGKAASLPLADQELAARERSAALAGLIRELPPQLAEVICLRYFEELSEKQMAAQLGIPAGTVKSRLHHGLKQLRPLLERIRL